MPIFPGSEQAAATPDEDRDADLIPVNKKLAVAGTAETLFTVPAGKVVRFISLVNGKGEGPAYIKVTPGGSATVADMFLDASDSWGEHGLQLAEGSYSFIGDPGKRPTVRGVVGVSDAPVEA